MGARQLGMGLFLGYRVLPVSSCPSYLISEQAIFSSNSSSRRVILGGQLSLSPTLGTGQDDRVTHKISAPMHSPRRTPGFTLPSPSRVIGVDAPPAPNPLPSPGAANSAPGWSSGPPAVWSCVHRTLRTSKSLWRHEVELVTEFLFGLVLGCTVTPPPHPCIGSPRPPRLGM